MKLITLLLMVCCLPAFANWSATDEVLLEEEAVQSAENFLKERELAREAKILQSIKRLDNNIEPMEIDREPQSLDDRYLNDAQRTRELLNSSKDYDEFEEYLFEAEAFDDDIEFLNEDFESVDQDIDSAAQSHPSKKVKNLKDKNSVGIKGKEEALINKLDNSDLMDFEKGIDIWGEDIKVNRDEDDGTDGIN